MKPLCSYHKSRPIERLYAFSLFHSSLFFSIILVVVVQLKWWSIFVRGIFLHNSKCIESSENAGNSVNIIEIQAK